jgi:hypothetical protein
MIAHLACDDEPVELAIYARENARDHLTATRLAQG